MHTNFDYISCGYGGIKLDIDFEIALNRHSYLVEVSGTNGENSTIAARLIAKFGGNHEKYITSRLAKIRQV